MNDSQPYFVPCSRWHSLFSSLTMTPGRYTCFISNNAGYFRLNRSPRSYS
jgi:hypothetical protein